MTTIKDVLCLLAIFIAYGIAGRLDYDDATKLEQIQKERQDAACPAEVVDSSFLTRLDAVADRYPLLRGRAFQVTVGTGSALGHSVTLVAKAAPTEAESHHAEP